MIHNIRIFDIFHGGKIKKKYCHISNGDPKIILINKYGENPIFANRCDGR